MHQTKNNKRKGNKFEDKVKKSINSGAVWFSPLDLKSDKNYIEVKYTDKPGYRISLQLLEKIWGQSLNMNKEPYLVIGIKRDDRDMFVLHCQINLERKEGVSNA